MLICLHIGAHGAASEYLQSRIVEERPSLAAGKVGVVYPGHFRKLVTDELEAAGEAARVRRGVARAVARMVTFHGAHDRVVMSDEDMAGAAIGPRGLYQDIRNRMAIVLGAMPAGHEARVFFCIRGYERHFSTLYALRSGEREAGDLKAYRDCALGARGWTDVVSEIAEVAGADRTVVWSYEDFATDPGFAGRALLGETMPKGLLRAEGARLPTFSRKGFAVYERAAPLLSARERADLAHAVSRFAFDAPDERFSLFDAQETVELAQRYQRDLEAIAALGVRLIAPEAQQPAAA